MLTPAEKLLWTKLRNRSLHGFKFRRQHPLKQFIADFYCHKARLVIEVDGGIHNSATVTERDQGRTFELDELGITVIRFTNEEVINNIDQVLKKIEKVLGIQYTSPPALSSRRGQGAPMRWKWQGIMMFFE